MSAYYATSAGAPATQYISEAESLGLQQAVNRLNQAYQKLGTALGS